MGRKTHWNYEIHVWYSMKRTVHHAEQPMGRKTHWNYEIHIWYSMKRPDTSSTSHWATYGMPNTVELRHSCLIFHETSSTSRGATYGMPNTMELRDSCLIFHETSSTSCGATYGTQNTMELRELGSRFVFRRAKLGLPPSWMCIILLCFTMLFHTHGFPLGSEVWLGFYKAKPMWVSCPTTLIFHHSRLFS